MLEILRGEDVFFVLDDDEAKACVRFVDEVLNVIYGATTGVSNGWSKDEH